MAQIRTSPREHAGALQDRPPRTALDRGRAALGPALSLVHTGRAPTRSALTSELGVTRATAGAIAAELEALGLITVDTSPIAGSAGRGRPSHRLSPAPEGPAVVAARVHAGGISVALVGLGGVVGPEVSLPLPQPSAPGPVLTAVAEAGARLVRESSRRCFAFGLAVPTPVTLPDRTALAAIYLDWPPGTAVGELFASAVADAGLGGLPTQVGNDANLSALAEHRHGAGRDARHLLYVMTGDRGVGGGLVVDGQVHLGCGGLALEVGQLTVHQGPDARLCPCGNRGCLDVESDPVALLAAAGIEPAPGTPVLDQARALLRDRGGEPEVRAAVERVVDRLGIGIAGMINILNPDRVVLGALHADLLAAAPERLPRVVAERAYWGRSGRVPIVPAELGEPDLIGAAELAWQPVLDDPLTLA